MWKTPLTKQYRIGWRDEIQTSDRVWEYCDVGLGWRKIIAELLLDLDSPEYEWDCTIIQVKEKYGTLRFYIGAATDKTWNRIHTAEHATAHTCMVCGEPGRTYTQGWWQTLCPMHAELQGYGYTDIEDAD